MLVRDFMEHSADRLPQKTALVCGRERFSYAELESRANRLAQAMMAHGVKRGDRVVIHLPNNAAAVVAIFATLKAGAVFVPLNPQMKADKLSYVLNNCRAAALISDLHGHSLPCTPSLKLIVSDFEVRTRQGAAVCLGFSEIQKDFPATRPPKVNVEDDLACLIYTSGSTGRPKGVMCEHRNVVFASGSIIEYLENTESDIVINVVPLSFDYGLYQLLMTFRFGGTLVLENSMAFPSLVLQRVTEEHCTGFPGVPTIFALLLGIDLGKFDLSSVRYLTNTAAALPPSHALELKKRFPCARIFKMYGLTETKRSLYLPPEELERRPGSVGIPIPGTEAWLEDEEGLCVPPGKIGELVLRGPHVMRGYWEDPEATALRFRFPPDGERICCTGDLFLQDNDEFFYFVGRKDDIIKTRGEKVAPKEIENILYELPGIAEAAVIGVTDRFLGQALKAFIVRRNESLSATQILAHCRARLEDFMVPQQIEFCASLPKCASGKIGKLELARDGTSVSSVRI